MTRRGMLLLVLAWCLLAASARAQVPPGGVPEETAPADSTETTFADRVLEIEARLTAEQDSLLSQGTPAAIVERHINTKRTRLLRQAEDADLEARGIARPLFFNCSNTPEVGVTANVNQVDYTVRWANSVKARDGGTINNNFGLGMDTFRRQDRTTETRNASIDYGSGQLMPVVLSAQARIDWSEDITTNTGGITNVNARKVRRVGLGVSRTQLLTGLISHNLMGGGYYNDQNAVNQQQINNFREGEINGAIRSGAPIAEGINVATRIYGIWRDGESVLSGFESPSSTLGDSLGAGAYYKRTLLQGAIVATQSSFDKRYLDFRRNSNGLIDTTESNLPAGASKVVQELEENDALDLKWDNTITVGSAKLVSKLVHTTQRERYRESAVGRKEKSEDILELRFTVPVGADSFAIGYKYNLRSDDQRIADASANRGRQDNKVREFSADWFRDVFSRTTLSARYQTELRQDIAEAVDGEPFNQNDRDRLSQNVRIRLEAVWPGVFSASLLGEYQAIDDISIRESRSANNNLKTTYEIAPSYRLFIGPRLTLNQTFRIYIQYQDYTFVDYPGVNKEDGFNKRGNLGTSLSWEPSDRLSVDLKHDYNQKYNGKRTSRDATGAAFYRRDQDQFINRIELGMAWAATDWLDLSTATYRTKDVVKRFGSTNTEDTRYSGELWVGGVIKHSWGPTARPLVLDATIRRYLAYGPNVTDTSDDYWRADVTMKWTF